MTEVEVTMPHPAFPMERRCPFQPPAEYALLRDHRPVSRVTLPDGSTARVVTSHQLVRQILSDPRTSADPDTPGSPRLFPAPRAFTRRPARPLVVLDPPEHTLHRRLIVQEFTTKRVQGLRPAVRRIVDERVDAVLDAGLGGGRRVDLMAVLARPVPTLVTCAFLGLSGSERDALLDACRAVSDAAEAGGTAGTAGAVDAAGGGGGADEDDGGDGAEVAARALHRAVAERVAARERRPTDDLLSRLVARYKEARVYDPDQVAGTVVGLLTAGQDTTSNMIGLGVAALLDNPDQLAILRDEPAMAPRAVDELLRYLTVADLGAPRAVTDDLRLGGVTVRAGEGVFALLAAANRDPEVFPQPDRLDLRRTSRLQHLAFGYGPHQCLGANLARLELEVVYRTLFERIPGLRLAVRPDELPFTQDSALYGLTALPVTW